VVSIGFCYNDISSIHGYGKQSQLFDWEHKEVFGGFLNDAIISREAACRENEVFILDRKPRP